MTSFRPLVAAAAVAVALPAAAQPAPAASPSPSPAPAPARWREDVVVQAVRADDATPVTKTDIVAREIEAANRGQEMPYLLAAAPAVNVQSDSGAAAGYAYLNLRGVGQTRLNITLDGVPLQDPEDQALYFANFGDFASVVDSVQIQRGIGTSSVGSASYGGSINFASVNPAEQAGVQLQAGAGSWGSARATAALDSGRRGAYAFYGRFSAQSSDGFRERSGVEQRSVYFGATRQQARSLFKLFGFSGQERSQLSYLATDAATLARDLRHNPLPPEERDDFGQDFLHLQYTRLVGSDATLTAQGYYNGAQGWFRIADAGSGALQQFGLDGHTLGLVLGATRHRGRLALDWGAHASAFSRDHFMDRVGGARVYENTGRKHEYSSFLRARWQAGRAQLWGDAQLRHARFEYRGAQPLGSVSWTFLNPKAGLRFDPTPGIGLYAFVGRMSREPARSDMLNGEDDASLPYDLSAVQPERLWDLEAGVELRRGAFGGRANVYAMEFDNEIALSGELSEIGLPVRRNVGRSHRRGVELELAWRPAPAWRLAANAALNRARIGAWTQYYDVYDEAGVWIDSLARVHRRVPALLSPGAIVNGSAEWSGRRGLSLALSGRWVSEAQLDNTGHPEFRTPAHFSLDGALGVSLARWLKRGEPRLRVQGTNLLGSRRLWPAGYSYLFLTRDASRRETLSGTAYYYPQATRSVFLTLDLRF
jgi:iron complex outermembrane receptor protein